MWFLRIFSIFASIWQVADKQTKYSEALVKKIDDVSPVVIAQTEGDDELMNPTNNETVFRISRGRMCSITLLQI